MWAEVVGFLLIPVAEDAMTRETLSAWLDESGVREIPRADDIPDLTEFASMLPPPVPELLLDLTELAVEIASPPPIPCDARRAPSEETREMLSSILGLAPASRRAA